MYASDMLSRMIPKDEIVKKDTELESEMNNYIYSVIDAIPVSDMKLKQLIDAQDEDEVTKKIKEYCLEGWPEKHPLQSAIRPY
eukprot:gene17150-8685_t